ncbi:MAG: NAD(+) synthase [Planctomycetota bacterium]|nr:MAG: NAD(+) synthase [Planctomycetota bacterium]
MHILRLAAAAINQTPLDWTGNRDRILAAIHDARAADAAVLCLPELCISGYSCEDQFFSAGVQNESLRTLAEIAPATKAMAVAVGLPLMVNRGLYNAAALLCDGELLGFTLKQHLAGDGIHYEPRWFRKWPAGAVQRIDLAGRPIPVGDLLYNCGGVRIGVEICRDAWVADRPGARLAAGGADVILNPTASHFSFGKEDVRRRIVLEGSRTFDVSFVFANVLGNEAGRAVFDGGTLIASSGKMLAEGPRLSFADHVLACADVDVEATRRRRASSSEPSLPPQAYGGETVHCPARLPSPQTACPTTARSPWDASPPPKFEEFSRAVPLALFDYLRKSRTSGMVVSLSGGADSAAVVAMAWLMAKLALADVGREAFIARLPQAPGLADAKDAEAILGRLLTCIYQATRNSGDATRQAAEAVARSVGAEFVHWNIDALVDGYVATASQAVGRQLDWRRDDFALQNIQARARGPAAWLLANLRNALLLATGNRSEAAVGYATMDGDTCGGLAPIAGVDKAFLLQWLKWMETSGPLGVGPLPALAAVTRQQPTAELRPASAGQTDEGDLMPYVVLDALERAAIRDKLTPIEAFQMIQPEFPQYSRQELGGWVERFYTLWCRSQWKRERLAASFHLDDRGLDAKGWCRFPILSGGFDRELAELRERLKQG